MRLAMVYPSRTKETRTEELLYSPLALAYLARHTPAHYRVRTYDEYVGDDVDPRKLNADLVAFSPITPGITRAYELADALRARGIACVAGGAHVSALPDEALEHFDTIVTGEGEAPWRQFLGDFERGSAKQTYFGRMDVPLDDLGTPCREHIHPAYEYPSVLTSRGCPYACSFCYLTVYRNRKYRVVPTDTILEDLDSIRGAPFMVVTDENFMGYSEANIENRKILLEKMIRRNYKFLWGCQSTINLSEQPELMTLMHRAGCRAVFLGFEAVTRESLKEVRKGHNVGLDYKRVVKNLHKHKLAVIASSILGMDSHTKDYPQQLIDAMKEAKADYPRVFLMTAWPGTPLFKDLEKEGRACRDWDQVRKDNPSIEFKHFTHEEILAARSRILRSFFNPMAVTRTVARWIFRDRSLIATFIRMAVRHRIAELIKGHRSFDPSAGPTDLADAETPEETAEARAPEKVVEAKTPEKTVAPTPEKAVALTAEKAAAPAPEETATPPRVPIAP